MLSLQSKLKHIGKAFNDALPCTVSHYKRPSVKFPYLIWAEVMEAESFHAGNLKAEQAISCVADYYTKTEFDPNLDTIQDVLETMGAAWRIEAVDYEDETALIHYTFEFEVCEIGET